MADTVDSLVMNNGPRNYIIRLTNVSDGTGESAVVKIDKSTLTDANGNEPGGMTIKEIWYSIQGFSSVRLFWDHTTDDEIVVLAPGNGYLGRSMLKDPKSAGDTGDVLLTTAGAVSGATYNILIWAVKE